MTKIVSQKARRSARGEECTFQIVDVCNGDPETTVLCHLPDETKGMGKKSDDISAAYGCSSCHDVIDGRVYGGPKGGAVNVYKAHKDFYMRRAQTRTLRRMIALGVVKYG